MAAFFHAAKWRLCNDGNGVVVADDAELQNFGYPDSPAYILCVKISGQHVLCIVGKLNGMIGATGPNVSWYVMSISLFTPPRTVGS